MSWAAATAASCRNWSVVALYRSDAVALPEVGERHPADVRLHRQPAFDHPQHLVVVQRERLHAEVVDREELRQPLRLVVDSRTSQPRSWSPSASRTDSSRPSS